MTEKLLSHRGLFRLTMENEEFNVYMGDELILNTMSMTKAEAMYYTTMENEHLKQMNCEDRANR